MRWSVYADLSRGLTDAERSAVFSALEELVVESGCVGPQKGIVEEVFFQVDAASLPEAAAEAARVMDAVLAKAAVQTKYALLVQPVREA